MTVAKVHEVLIKSQCTRAAERLVSSARCTMESEIGDYFMDIEDEPEQLC